MKGYPQLHGSGRRYDRDPPRGARRHGRGSNRRTRSLIIFTGRVVLYWERGGVIWPGRRRENQTTELKRPTSVIPYFFGSLCEVKSRISSHHCVQPVDGTSRVRSRAVYILEQQEWSWDSPPKVTQKPTVRNSLLRIVCRSPRRRDTTQRRGLVLTKGPHGILVVQPVSRKPRIIHSL